MIDFVDWCLSENLIEVQNDGTISWKEEAVCCGKSKKSKKKLGGGRDQTKDLSADYKEPAHNMGVVWPFKIAGKKGKKSDKK